MGINDRVAAKVTEFKGQKSGQPIESYSIESAEELRGFHINESALVKVNGATILTTVPGSDGAISSLGYFDGIILAQRKKSIYTHFALDPNNIINSGDLLFDNNLLSENRVLFSYWRNRVFLANSVDFNYALKINETSGGFGLVTGSVGLDPPSNEYPYNTSFNSSWLSSSAGGNIADGTYYYLITLYDGNTNTESPAFGARMAADGIFELSPNGALGPLPQEIILSGGPKKVEIDKTLLIPYLQLQQQSQSRATHFIIYRAQKVSGTTLFDSFQRVPLSDGTSSQNESVFININDFINDNKNFIDNSATASLPTVFLPENNSPPPTALRAKQAEDFNQQANNTDINNYSSFIHTKFFKDQLFGIGASSIGMQLSPVTINAIPSGAKTESGANAGTVFNFKDLLHGSEVYQPDYWPYIWEVGVGDGQRSTALGVLGDIALLVFKENSAYYLAGSSPDNYILRIMDTSKGCFSANTEQETPIGVITLDRSGFILWNKIGQGDRISANIQDIINSIDFAYASKFSSIYDPVNRKYMCTVVEDGVSEPSIQLILDIDSMEWSIDRDRIGLSAICGSHTDTFANRALDSSKIGNFYHYIGSKNSGDILDASSEDIVLYNNTPVESMWKSGPINFGDDQHKKKVRWLYIRARSKGSWTVDIEIIPDYDESRKFQYLDFNVNAAQSEWFSSQAATDGTLYWDDGIWATDKVTRKIAKIPVTCLGYSFQIRITNRESDNEKNGFAIEMVSIEGTRMGR